MLKDKKTGKILGFQSFFFQREGRAVLQQAIRVDATVQGAGVGKRFSAMGEDYLRLVNPEVRDMPDIVEHLPLGSYTPHMIAR